jgi:RNA polymerase sigma-70 factor (ECF subfamily)
VWRTLRRLGVREADLEDTVQEVFMVFHRRLNDFDHACPVGPWLMGIAHRVAAAERRRARHRRELPTASEQLENRPGSINSPHEDVEAIQRRRRVQEALDTLDLDRRIVFVMYELEGVACTDIAAALDVPLNTVYSRLRLARERFKGAVVRLRLSKGAV